MHDKSSEKQKLSSAVPEGTEAAEPNQGDSPSAVLSGGVNSADNSHSDSDQPTEKRNALVGSVASRLLRKSATRMKAASAALAKSQSKHDVDREPVIQDRQLADQPLADKRQIEREKHSDPPAHQMSADRRQLEEKSSQPFVDHRSATQFEKDNNSDNQVEERLSNSFAHSSDSALQDNDQSEEKLSRSFVHSPDSALKDNDQSEEKLSSSFVHSSDSALQDNDQSEEKNASEVAHSAQAELIVRAAHRLDLSKIAPGKRPAVESADTLSELEKLAVDFLNTETKVYELPTERVDDFRKPSSKTSQTLNRIDFSKGIKTTQTKLGSLESNSQRAEKVGKKVATYASKHSLGISVAAACLGIFIVSIGFIGNQIAKETLKEGIKKTNARQYVAAVALLDKSIGLNSDYSDAYLYRGRCHYVLGHTKEAYEDYDKFLKFQPDNTEALEKHAAVGVKLAKNEQAADDYKKLLDLQPYVFNKSAEALTNLGLAYRRRGQYKQAIAQLNRIADMFPNNVNAFAERALCYQALHNVNKAIADSSRALRLDPNNAKALIVRARSYQLAHDFVHDLPDLNRAVLTNPNDSAGYIGRGIHFAELKQYAAAAENFDLAVARDSDIESYQARSDFLASRGNYQAAVMDLNNLSALLDFEYSGEFYLKRANLLQHLQQYHSALSDLQAAAQKDPRNATVYLLRSSDIHTALKQYKAAIADCNNVLRREPRNAAALDKRGVNNHLAGNKMTAKADFISAMKADPRRTGPYIHRGDLYLADKQYVSAAADYREALRLDPSIDGVKDKLSACLSNSSKLATLSPVRVHTQSLTKAQLAEIAGMDVPMLSQKGFDALHRGEIQYALVSLMRAVQLNPNDVNARRYLFGAHVANNDAAEAATQLGALIGLSKNPDDEITMAKSLSTIGNESQLTNIFDQLIDKYSREPATLVQLAKLCKSVSCSTSASRACDKGLQHATDRAQIQELQGIKNLIAKEAADQAEAVKVAAQEEKRAPEAAPNQ